MQIEAELDLSEVDRLLDGLESSLPQLQMKIGKQVRHATFAESQNRCPVKKGILKKSGYERVEGRNHVIGYTAPYAVPQELGSRPHIIVPKNKRFLHWKVGGKSIFAKKVNHPGNPPKAYLRGAWAAIRPRVPKIAKAVIEQHLRGVS